MKKVLFIIVLTLLAVAEGRATITINGTTAIMDNPTSQEITDNFAALEGMTSITIIGAFEDSNNWSSVKDKFRNSLTTLDLSKCDLSFYNTTVSSDLNIFSKMETFYFPVGVTAIPDNAFKGVTSLANVTIPITVTSIGTSAFENCTNLKHVVIPEGITTIGNQAFYQCRNLESISLPTTLTSIGDKCFVGCMKLLQFTIPKTSSRLTLGRQLFDNSGLRDLYIMETDPDNIPLIYAKVGDNNGTFDGEKLYAAGTAPNVFTDKNPPSNYTSEEIEVMYMEIGRGNNTVSTAGLTILHFPESMRSFYDKNPWYGTGTEYTDDNYPYLSDTYMYVDSEGNPWPARVLKSDQNNKMTNAEGKWIDSDGNVVNDKNDAAFDPTPDRWAAKAMGYEDSRGSDYARRERAGLPSTYSKADDEPLAEAWRQFLLMRGTGEGHEDETFTKKLDDTWYTMCFPFDLSDEQLEQLFNANYNICEFTAANIVKTDEDDDAMVLYFTRIAKSTYIDEDEEKVYYSESNWKDTYNDAQLRYYKDADGNEYHFNSSDVNVRNKWLKIRGVLAFAGHPYMVHPNVGVVAGLTREQIGGVGNTVMSMTTRYLTGIKKRFSGTGYDPHENPNEAAGYREIGDSSNPNYYLKIYTQKQVPLLDCREQTTQKEHADEREGEPHGYMTFVGKTSETREKIPQNSYFLGCVYDTRADGGQKETTFAYPKYYRQTDDLAIEDAHGNWTQYTAIVKPDSEAKPWLKENIWDKNPAISSSAKSANVLFDDMESFNDIETNIDQVLMDAEQKQLPVEYYKVIFNINGQVVKTGTTDTRNLPTGVYIINGKKYFVK